MVKKRIDYLKFFILMIFIITSCSETTKMKSIARVFKPDSDDYYFCGESLNDRGSVESCVIKLDNIKYYKKEMAIYTTKGKLHDYLLYKPEGPIHHSFEEVIKDTKLPEYLKSSYIYMSSKISIDAKKNSLEINGIKFEIDKRTEDKMILTKEKNNSIYILELY